MKVLVMGVDEFIGRRVALALAASGWAQPVADAAELRGSGIDGIAARTGLAAALDNAEAVVNCVSSGPKAILHAAGALDAAFAGRSRPPLLVHVSSMSVYGGGAGTVDETSALSGELGPYAQAKVDAEALARQQQRHVVLRPGVEYGPGGELWSGRIASWLYARRIGDLGAAGDGICNLVHVDDLAAAALLCLRRPEAMGATFNLAMPDAPTWNEYLVRYARALGAVPVRRITRRRRSLETRLLAPPLKVAQLVLQRAGLDRWLPAPIPPSLLRLAGQEIRLDSTRARTTLGWQCRTLDLGLAETAAYYARPQRVPGSPIRPGAG